MLGSYLLIIHADALTPIKASTLSENCEASLIKGKISKNDFINTEMWFEDDEKVKGLCSDGNYQSAKIKELLFDLNKESDVIFI